MNNPIAQFLSVLGGSANPALLGQGEASLNTGNPQFRSMLMSQFGGQVIVDGEANENTEISLNANALLNAINNNTEQTNGQPLSIWQIMNTTQNQGDTKNALVLQLSQQGVDQGTIDSLVTAIEKSDLVTILQDPSLAAQLQNIVTDTNLPIDSGEMNSFVQSIINQFIDEQKSQSPLVVDVVDMDLEEFKEWKKANFVDLAAYLSTEKTKVGANGEIVKILQGPSFLAEDGQPAEKVIDIIPAEKQMTIEEFIALQQFQTVPNTQQLSGQVAPFTPIPLQAVYQNASTPTKSAVQQSTSLEDPLLANDQTTNTVFENSELSSIGQGFVPIENRPMTTADSTVPGSIIVNGQNNGSTGNAMIRNAAALGSNGNGTKTNANGNSMLTPFMTPAEMSGLITGGDGYTPSDGMMPFEATFKTASNAANPILTQPSAGQPHPATQTVAVTIQRVAANTKGGDNADVQRYRLQLDPPEMGRVDVELEFDVGNKVKAMIVADKPETLQLLQRDSHALMKALQDAGFDGVGDNNLEFSLSQNQNDSAGQGGNNPNQNGQNALQSDELETENTEMTVILDPVTGQQRINMVV
jgi:hypothetical protein